MQEVEWDGKGYCRSSDRGKISAMDQARTSIDRMFRLIDLERRAEIEESASLLGRLSGPQLEARGVSIGRLAVADEDAGLGGRILLGFERTSGEPLPPSRIGPGDIVRVAAPDPSGGGRGKGAAERQPSGVVWRKTARRVTVAFDDLPEDGVGEGALRIDRVANDITYRRMREALDRLRGADRGRPAQLREVLLGEREPRFDAVRPLEPLDRGLNTSQVEAVRLALAARDVALIHGPPGTGKTTAVAELVRQAVARRERVLATAPSNVAVDNLAEILARSGARVVRIGHPARLLPAVVDLSLDAQVADHPHTRLAADLRRQAARALKRIGREKDYSARRTLRDELRALRREIASAEEDAVREVLDRADVVLATCTGAADSVLAAREFDLAVVDEAAQALEPAAWIPILRSDRLVLAGDHRQLPPTIISRDAEREGLGVTLFDRLMARGGERWSRLLAIQYRMHRLIMEYPSRELYEGRLEADPSVAGHLLTGLPDVEEAPETLAPLLFIDTSGCGYDEETEAEGESKENAGEAEAAARHAERLVELGVPAGRIGVITPYSAQVRRLRDRLAPLGDDLEVDTVDGFQGREKEAIVISLVRSNPRGEVGFLADVRRINVAVTRARRHLAVFGDGATVARDPFIAGFIAHCEEAGAYRTAWELGLGDLDVRL
jgi:ATP-dependent RNA/DNA helicase IGHMBP2